MQSIIVGIFFALLGSFLSPAEVMAQACEVWIAKVASAQGSVQARRAGATQWTDVQRRDTFCSGAVIRVGPRSRAAIVAHNEAVYRLEENTTITITAPQAKQSFWLSLKRGAAYFFSRAPRSLRVMTPFANAGVEGTEFVVKVTGDQVLLSVFAGRVIATNAMGSMTLASGQSAVVKAGQAPAPRVLARPRDAVQWALYYPPIVDFRPADFSGEAAWQAMVRQSIQYYQEGELQRAFASLANAPPDIRDARFFIYRAALLLTVGGVDEAHANLESALQLEPGNRHAPALQALIAVVQNRKEEALTLARRSVESAPDSSTAHVALSYAQQAHFDLQGALASLEKAVQLAPENALAWARLAELRLSVEALKKALDAAQQAVSLSPHVARAQTVLGFAYLTQMRVRDAKAAFERAIELDQAAPLPRLGLGLAEIRQGDLKKGRGGIEIAASLDPNSSLMRSYLGKAYFEEKRNKLAKNQFAAAKTLDPQDPTPWFYDAIRKQTVNRPVEALQDLQKSIELNDNRAVYRSRLLLDEDLAARSATLGRIYNDLGFQQLALVESWKSQDVDPGQFSSHRLLADVYAALPRHEIARVSELLQSQLLQPIHVAPSSPQLAESDLLILQGAGPAEPSFNEFHPLFNRNRFTLHANGMVGEHDTFGNEFIHAGLWNKLSYSIGQFHYETDGFRDNNELKQNIYNVFAQSRLFHNMSIQAEFRRAETQNGDLVLRFSPDEFLPFVEEERKTNTFRLGLRYAMSPSSQIISSFIYQDVHFTLDDPIPGLPDSVNQRENDSDSYLAEFQYLLNMSQWHLISGLGHFDENMERGRTLDFGIPGLPRTDERVNIDNRHTNIYVYTRLGLIPNLGVTLGLSADFFQGEVRDRDQLNPKFGLVWRPFPQTTIRAAAFRVLKRSLNANQTIEPTQVAGFNQFFDDIAGTDAWRFGVALDQQFTSTIYGGVEFSERHLNVPFLVRPANTLTDVDWEERLGRAYLYWMPHAWLTARAAYQYERLKRDVEFVGSERFSKVTTHRLPLGVGLHHPSGFTAQLQATYINQKGDFFGLVVQPGMPIQSDDDFVVVDMTMTYRLPKRWGLVTVGAKNIFNEEFAFQDTDLAQFSLQPQRFFFGRITLTY